VTGLLALDALTRRDLLALALGALVAPLGAGAADEGKFVVIVHLSNRFDRLTRSKLTFLFLRRVSRWPWGAQVEPVDLASRGPVRREFTRQVLRTTDEQLNQYWIDQLTTRGVSGPIEVADAAAAKIFVAARPGAVAYIPVAELDHTVKVMTIDP
jgi:hypothetical protein